MSAKKPKPGVTRLGRFVLRWRFDRNPLRRATDRAETALLAGEALGLIASACVLTLAGALALWTIRSRVLPGS